MPIGFVMGAMSAIQSNTNNYYCALNTTAARLQIQQMAVDLGNGNLNNAVNDLY